MDAIQAVVLAVIQGITEFLPISSSGHLILTPLFFDWPDQGLWFDVAANTGSMLAVLLYFRQDVAHLLQGFFRSIRERSLTNNPEGALAWGIGWATIPAGLAGLAFKDMVENHARDPKLIAFTLTFYALLLAWADLTGKRQKDVLQMRWREAILIGVAQALALVPGTSRSGITITMGLFAGFTREAAARFSFLLSIPIGILAAGLDAVELVRANLTLHQWGILLLGVGVSALVSYLVIDWLLGWLRKQSLMVFVVYRLFLGGFVWYTLVR